MKFRVGQTVFSPFGVVKIIYEWAKSFDYDVKFINKKDGVVRTQTYTFRGNELFPFYKGGVAPCEDDAVQIIDVKETDGDLLITFSVWIQVEIAGDLYFIEKQYKEKLAKNE